MEVTRASMGDVYMEKTAGVGAVKVRRKRTVYSRAHLDLLHRTFNTNPYPGIKLREKLSLLTGVHESRIQVWFQNKRARKNKSKKKQDEDDMTEHMERPPFHYVPRISRTTKSKFKVEDIEKGKLGYMGSAQLFQLNHFRVTDATGPHVPRSCTNYVAPSRQMVSAGPLGPSSGHLQPYNVLNQPASTTQHPGTTGVQEKGRSGCTFASSNPVESSSGQTEDCSLEEMLEEMQSFWADIVDDCPTKTEDLLYFVQ